MFSRRLPSVTSPNALTRQLDRLRSAGERYIDLTEGNPTRAGLTYPPSLLAGLADAQALRYEPQPLGLPAARGAVASEYARRGADVDPAQVVLTASSSEAYSWLFKLLCDPGDRVLVPRPSYPLFEYLTRLEGVLTEPYDLEYHRRWDIDLGSVERAAAAGAKALVVVSPNNPTGSYVTRRERDRLLDICATRGLALISDEVFVDYALEGDVERATDLALQDAALAFTLGGLSKAAGLPQLKLGWIVVGGPLAARTEALDALEVVADSYLSVSTPVQVAAPALLAHAAVIRDQIHARVRANLEVLRTEATRYPATQVLVVEGGWYAVVRVPAARSEESLVLDLLEAERILVHPGYFFDFPREAYLIVSLLPETAVFVDAIARMLRHMSFVTS